MGYISAFPFQNLPDAGRLRGAGRFHRNAYQGPYSPAQKPTNHR